MSDTPARPQPVPLSRSSRADRGDDARPGDSPPPPAQYRQAARQHLEHLYTLSGLKLEEATRDQLLSEVMAEVAGYGPLQPFLDDPAISEIMVNGTARYSSSATGN